MHVKVTILRKKEYSNTLQITVYRSNSHSTLFVYYNIESLLDKRIKTIIWKQVLFPLLQKLVTESEHLILSIFGRSTPALLIVCTAQLEAACLSLNGH